MNCDDIKYYSDRVSFRAIYLRSTSRSVEYQINLVVDNKRCNLSNIIYTAGDPPNIDKNNPFLQSMWVKYLTEQNCTPEQIRSSFSN